MENLQFEEIFVVLLMVIGFLLCLVIINMVQISKLKRRVKQLVHNEDGMSIETVVHQYYGDIEEIKMSQSEIMAKQKEIQGTLLHCITKMGVIRFNPFGEVGGNQSFAIALLDSENTGIVISSLYGRDSSRFYGKPVVKGKSNYQLSDEEMEAVERAITGKNNEI